MEAAAAACKAAGNAAFKRGAYEQAIAEYSRGVEIADAAQKAEAAAELAVLLANRAMARLRIAGSGAAAAGSGDLAAVPEHELRTRQVLRGHCKGG